MIYLSNWSVLRSLSALPMLTSLDIVLNDINTGLDQSSCQIIAEIVPMLVHFGIFFRRRNGLSHPDDGVPLTGIDPTLPIEEDGDPDSESFLESIFNEYQMSIEDIRRRILRLSLYAEPLIVVEEEGCGLTVWL